MPILEEKEALAFARRVVEASPAHETEVTIDCVESRFVRFADCGPTQTADRERCEVSVRVRIDAPAEPRETRDGRGTSRTLQARGSRAAPSARSAREARATAASLDLGEARRAIDRAIAIASNGTPDPALLPLGGPVEVAATRFDVATREHSFAEKAAWVEAALDACERAGFMPAGLADTTVVSRTLCNSAGRAVHGSISRASFSLTAGASDSSGFAEQIASSVRDIDATAVVRRAVDKATSGGSPRAIDAGEYTVVLEPAAVSALVLFTAYQGFGARAVEEESSFLCGRIGEDVFARSITLVDDARHAAYPGFAFDGEGSPRQRTTLVERGRLRGPVTDRRYAQALSVANTGHALTQPSLEGPKPQNLALVPGDRSLSEMIRDVERGLLVTQLHYVNLIDPRELVLTGMTRNGTFWIENGRVRHAVKNLRFTESLVRALARVREVGRETAVCGALFEGEMIAAPLSIDGFRFTSATDF